MFLIETTVAIAFLIITFTSLELIAVIEYRRQESKLAYLNDSMIPYEELEFREEINSMSLEEIDELFTYQDDIWSEVEDMNPIPEEEPPFVPEEEDILPF
ncbi:TPA: hypothetical protein MBH56_005493 [Klebsiella pneumoniae]|nr:hypothetical protein [Klebsiella pneumoniae]